MKNQNHNLVFALAGLFLVMLLAVGVVIAQSAPRNTWTSPSNGITVTAITPAQPQGTVIYNFVGTGKNRAPKGVGATDPIVPPTKCPRHPVTEAYYFEIHDIKDADGNVIAKIKIVSKPDCTTDSRSILDKDGNKPITLS